MHSGSRNNLEERPSFNNCIKSGELLDQSVKHVPYLFIPRHLSDCFIMPDRAFCKGAAARRSKML